jgi:hypothetical protein
VCRDQPNRPYGLVRSTNNSRDYRRQFVPVAEGAAYILSSVPCENWSLRFVIWPHPRDHRKWGRQKTALCILRMNWFTVCGSHIILRFCIKHRSWLYQCHFQSTRGVDMWWDNFSWISARSDKSLNVRFYPESIRHKLICVNWLQHQECSQSHRRFYRTYWKKIFKKHTADNYKSPMHGFF